MQNETAPVCAVGTDRGSLNMMGYFLQEEKGAMKGFIKALAFVRAEMRDENMGKNSFAAINYFWYYVR